MDRSMAEPSVDTLRKRVESVRPTMAKASLNKVEHWKTLLGRAIERTFEIAGVDDSEAAAMMGKDKAQIARWIAGTERPQLDTILSVVRFRHALLVALAEAAGEGIDIETTIRIRNKVA